MFRTYGQPPSAPPWASPFGKHYPDPTKEENREFYLGKNDETPTENVEIKEDEVNEKGRNFEKSRLKKRLSGFASFIGKVRTVRNKFRYQETETEAEKQEMMSKLEQLTLKLLKSNVSSALNIKLFWSSRQDSKSDSKSPKNDLLCLRPQVISCPSLTWDPASDNAQEKRAIKRSVRTQCTCMRTHTFITAQ